MSDVNVLLTSHIDMLFGWSNCPRATLLPKKRCLAVQFSYVQHSENIRLASTDFFLATNPHKQATGNFSRSCQNNCSTKVTQSFSNKRFQYDDLFNNLATHLTCWDSNQLLFPQRCTKPNMESQRPLPTAGHMYVVEVLCPALQALLQHWSLLVHVNQKAMSLTWAGTGQPGL